MTDILGFQKLKICEPHGIKDILVVKFDGDYLIGFDPSSTPPFNWLKLKEGPGDYGYCFYNLEKKSYNINWNIIGIQNIDKNITGKISACLFPDDTSPIIVEVLEVIEKDNKKKVKLKVFEQMVKNFENEEELIFEETITFITMHSENDEYYIDNIEDTEG
jgi:hypothetical protein